MPGPSPGGKHTTWEGGHRVPTIVRWPAVVRPGTVNQELTSSLDWFPTFASLVGFELKPGVVYDGVANAEAIFLGGYQDNETDPSMSARELLVRTRLGSPVHVFRRSAPNDIRAHVAATCSRVLDALRSHSMNTSCSC